MRLPRYGPDIKSSDKPGGTMSDEGHCNDVAPRQRHPLHGGPFRFHGFAYSYPLLNILHFPPVYSFLGCIPFVFPTWLSEGSRGRFPSLFDQQIPPLAGFYIPGYHPASVVDFRLDVRRYDSHEQESRYLRRIAYAY